MNGYLLDTNVILCWLSDPEQLAEPARAVIANGANLVYMSAAAAWEMAIKKSLGRLDMPTGNRPNDARILGCHERDLRLRAILRLRPGG